MVWKGALEYDIIENKKFYPHPVPYIHFVHMNMKNFMNEVVTKNEFTTGVIFIKFPFFTLNWDFISNFNHVPLPLRIIFFKRRIFKGKNLSTTPDLKIKLKPSFPVALINNRHHHKKTTKILKKIFCRARRSHLVFICHIWPKKSLSMHFLRAILHRSSNFPRKSIDDKNCVGGKRWR